MEAEVILDGVRAEEDDSLSCHHQDEAIQSLQRENTFRMMSTEQLVVTSDTDVTTKMEEEESK